MEGCGAEEIGHIVVVLHEITPYKKSILMSIKDYISTT